MLTLNWDVALVSGKQGLIVNLRANCSVWCSSAGGAIPTPCPAVTAGWSGCGRRRQESCCRSGEVEAPPSPRLPACIYLWGRGEVRGLSHRVGVIQKCRAASNIHGLTSLDQNSQHSCILGSTHIISGILLRGIQEGRRFRVLFWGFHFTFFRLYFYLGFILFMYCYLYFFV